MGTQRFATALSPLPAGPATLHALVPLATVADTEIEALLDRAFGPDRHLRTAYRVRSGLAPIAELSFAALDDHSGLLGAIQCWTVEHRGDSGAVTPLVMVGPVAVEPSRQQAGLGRELTAHMLAQAAISTVPGCDALMLIGDPEYYGRFFGFTTDRTARWRLPGPFEPRRLLARGPAVPDTAGMIGPRSA